MPVIYESNRQPIAQLQVYVGSSSEEVSVDREELIKILERLVDPKAWFVPMNISGTQLVENTAGGKWIPLSHYRSAPYSVTYDEKKLEIQIKVPPQIRRKSTTSFGMRDEYSQGNEPDTEPLWFSSFLNVSASQDFDFSNDPNNDGRQPLRGVFENGTRLGGVVFEGSVSYYENRDDLSSWTTWTRQDFRLVKDFPENQTRTYFGDIPIATMGYQSGVSLGGVGAVTKTSLDPSRQTTQGGRFEIFLERPSKVTAIINGQAARAVELPAGRHDLTDFSFSAGPNNLKIEIEDDLGRKDVREFSFFSGASLLGRGVSEFRVFLGAPYKQERFSRNYIKSEPTGSFFYRRGWSEQLTLGANLQLKPGEALIGAETALTSARGSFSTEPAMSMESGRPTGMAIRNRFSTLDRGGPKGSQRNYSLSIDSRSPRFSLFSSSGTVSPIMHSISLGFGQSLSDKASLSAGASYNLMRRTETTPFNSFGLSLGVSRRWKDGPSISIAVREDRSPQGIMESSLGLYLNWNLGGSQSVNASYNVKDDATHLGWNYSSPDAGVGKHDIRLGVKKAGSARGFEDSASYVGNRGTIGLNHASTWTPQDQQSPQVSAPGAPAQNGYSQNHFALQGQTAIVFAGGRFGVGRPVLDSFALVSPEKNLSGDTLYINRKSDGSSYYAESGGLGPAVMPEIPSYSPYSLTITPEQIKGQAVKAGMDKDTFRFLPPYKSGYLIALGTDLNISIGGYLLFEDDSSPVITKPGRIISLTDSSFKEVPFFTSRSGRTRVDGFKPGRYELEFFDGSLEKFAFEIPEGTPDYFDFGKFKLKKVVKQ